MPTNNCVILSHVLLTCPQRYPQALRFILKIRKFKWQYDILAITTWRAISIVHIAIKAIN